ncbi:MAG: hypothetical protein ACYCUC_01780 [Candidatus Dormibacteria bacterium]
MARIDAIGLGMPDGTPRLLGIHGPSRAGRYPPSLQLFDHGA